MTGEMSKDEVTRENYPLYFAAADTVEGATVEPFDQYQGPYILVPGKGRYFLSSDDGYEAQWYAEQADTVSETFPAPGVARKVNGQWIEYPLRHGVDAFGDLVNCGGTPVEHDEREDPTGHQSYCHAVRVLDAECDCEGYGEYIAAKDDE